MPPLDRHIVEVVEELQKRLAVAVPHGLRRIIVFGSRVRGDAGEDADLDLVALVDHMTPDLEHRMDDAAYAVMWAFDFHPIISLKVFETTRFEAAVRAGLPFYRNVIREGVTL